MTTKELGRRSVIEEFESSRDGQLEMAVARAGVRANAILNAALIASGMSQKELASEMGVSEGRVSQVLQTDESIKVSTLARYLRAMGYGLSLEAEPADESVPPLRKSRGRRQSVARAVQDVIVQVAEKDNTRGYIVSFAPPGYDTSHVVAPARVVARNVPTEMRVRTRQEYNATAGHAPRSVGAGS